MGALVSLARLLPHLRGVNRQMVRRQNIDLVFDDSALKDMHWSTSRARSVLR